MEYSEVLALLEENRDETYRQFNEGLIPGAEGTSLGVRLPVLRQMAKRVCKGDWREFLNASQGKPLYEITMLRGLVIAGGKCDFSEKLEHVALFVPEIQNWAVCDCFCGSLKDAKKHLAETWDFLAPYGKRQEEFFLRFYLIMLMDYFLTEEYIDRALEAFFSTQQEAYYVKMAQAWAIATAFAKFRDKTLCRLEERKLSPWVQNKAIQKCRESYRVSREDKEYLKALKL